MSEENLEQLNEDVEEAERHLGSVNPDTVPRAEFDELRRQVEIATKRFNKALLRMRKATPDPKAAAISEPAEEAIEEIPATPTARRKGGMLDTILDSMVRKSK